MLVVQFGTSHAKTTGEGEYSHEHLITLKIVLYKHCSQKFSNLPFRLKSNFSRPFSEYEAPTKPHCGHQLFEAIIKWLRTEQMESFRHLTYEERIDR